MIRLEHVSKTYQQGVPALNDVNIDIEQGSSFLSWVRAVRVNRP